MKKNPPNSNRIRSGNYGSDDGFGMNGAFLIKYPAEPDSTVRMLVIASDGSGREEGEAAWERITVTVRRVTKKKDSDEVAITPIRREPTNAEMAWLKSVFFEDDEAVFEFVPSGKPVYLFQDFVRSFWRPAEANIELPPLHYFLPY